MTYASLVLTHVRAGVRSLAARFAGERGQDLIEYALLGGVIAAAMIGVGVGLYSGALSSMAAGISDCVDFKQATSCDPIP